MPKINIREFDLTKPGLPGAYRNFSVMVPGFVKSTSAVDITMLDDNGICEFGSLADFKKFSKSSNYATLQNYRLDDETLLQVGNQITYELLSLGYTVVYKAFTKFKSSNPTSEADWTSLSLEDEEWWMPLKDKAAYDFRYILPALLRTSSDTDTDTDPETDPETDPGTDPETDPETDPQTEPQTEAQTNPQTDPTPNTDPNTTPDQTEPTDQSVTFNYATIISNAVDLARHIETEHTIEVADANLFKAGRGDCFALIDIPEDVFSNKKTPKQIIGAVKGAIAKYFNTAKTRYAAFFTPAVTYNGLDSYDDFNKNLTLPASFHYLTCAKRAFNNFNEWYAIAGYTRGVSTYSIASTSVNFGDYAINELQPRYSGTSSQQVAGEEAKADAAVNVIANIRGSFYLWGNRTAETIDAKDDSLTAKHFLNIRQLCTTLKKQIYVTCRWLTFDPNSDTLWINFTSGIKPILEKMKADQGIKDYKIVQLPTQRKATLKALIRIIPIEAVEDFDIAISLEDSISGEVEIDG